MHVRTRVGVMQMKGNFQTSRETHKNSNAKNNIKRKLALKEQIV